MGKSTIRSLIDDWLVVWNMAFLTFHILGLIVPTDELIFFRGVGIPPTSMPFKGMLMDLYGDLSKVYHGIWINHEEMWGFSGLAMVRENDIKPLYRDTSSKQSKIWLRLKVYNRRKRYWYCNDTSTVKILFDHQMLEYPIFRQSQMMTSGSSEESVFPVQDYDTLPRRFAIRIENVCPYWTADGRRDFIHRFHLCWF